MERTSPRGVYRQSTAFNASRFVAEIELALPKAYFRRHARPEEVAKRKAYKQSSDGRAANKRYRDKPERMRVYRRQWSKSPEQRTRHNRNQKRYQELHGRQRGYRKYIGQLISQQGEACPLCTKVLPKTLRYIHVDHIIPQWHGGTEAFENLQEYPRCGGNLRQ